MRKLKLLFHFYLLIATTTLLALPNKSFYCVNLNPVVRSQVVISTDIQSLTYDQIIHLLEEIEEGDLENKCSPEQLEQINQFLALLAIEGILPNDEEEEASITEDVEELLEHRKNSLHHAFLHGESAFVPTILNIDGYGAVIPCGWIKKSWKSTKAFVKKHKKAIIIGAIIVVTVSAVTIVVIASSSGAASTLAGSAAAIAASNASDSNWEEEESSTTSSSFEATMKEEIQSFKEKVAEENLLESSFSEEDLPMESKGKTLGNVWAHQTLEGIHTNFESLPSSKGCLELGHREIDKKFPIENDYSYHYPGLDYDNKISPYQIQAEKAFDLGYYPEAIRNLNQAIDIEPNNSTLYLERAASQFHMGQYEQALEDFETFTMHSNAITEQNPLSISEFSVGFTKGLPQGVYESGKGIMTFLTDFVTHPVHTSTQVVQSLSTLAELVREEEWEMIGKAMAPEICELVKEWDTLPSDKKGELAGYAIGKHGTDILVPGTIAKVASKSVKSAKKLAAVCKNIKLAEETLVLETASGIGNVAKVGEIVTSGKSIFSIGKSLDFTESEMSYLKKIGMLEKNISMSLEKLSSQFQSEVIKDSIKQHRHIKMIKESLTKPIKEVEKSIRSYEKQILIHKDKIANPSKYCPEWEKMNTQRRDALINKKWPTEINGYREQQDILQEILKERVSYE